MSVIYPSVVCLSVTHSYVSTTFVCNWSVERVGGWACRCGFSVLPPPHGGSGRGRHSPPDPQLSRKRQPPLPAPHLQRRPRSTGQHCHRPLVNAIAVAPVAYGRSYSVTRTSLTNPDIPSDLVVIPTKGRHSDVQLLRVLGIKPYARFKQLPVLPPGCKGQVPAALGGDSPPLC